MIHMSGVTVPAIRRILGLVAMSLMVMLPQQSWALNIVLSNDDGFETANIHALYQRLKAAGHDVVLSGPTQNNSGKGGAMNFLAPVTPLTKDTRFATVKAGAAGAGVSPSDADVFYVDGTPVMAMLYGLDVVAAKRWGGQPDLVISGPNEGANLGAINNSSGTFNNALYAINRGVPAIAVSYSGTTGRSYTALTDGAVEYRVADIVMQLVNRLDAQKGSDGRLLPLGVGLNVNIPVLVDGVTPAFKFSRLGVATDYQPVFYESLSNSPVAVGYGAGVPFPGISFVNNSITPPAGVVVPNDTAASSERNVVVTGAIAVSVVEGVPQARRSNEDTIKIRLNTLFNQP
ncbi:5'/3'-nucleotidase SurE [Stenotrophobium rhamnosiphilum]|nr:5'/3'-nucleotidase SurE [Stenotrophobium rhamnosiphilum]